MRTFFIARKEANVLKTNRIVRTSPRIYVLYSYYAQVHTCVYGKNVVSLHRKNLILQ